MIVRKIMKSVNGNDSPRRQIAYVGPWNTLQLEKRDPYIVLFWSIAYAGLGHILLDKYFRGFILLAGEIFLNAASHLNLAIFYTVTMRFDLAAQAQEPGWFMLYLAVYTFAIFDSYREAVEINKTYILAAREDAEIQCFAINSGSFTHINSVPPWVTALWSAVFPGAGCFLVQRMNRALYMMALWVVIAYLSGFYPAVIHTFAGQFELAKTDLNIQWFLNIPSLWFYAVYETYACAISNNKLYRWELSKFLKKKYQSRRFIMPDKLKDAENYMHVFSVFEHSAKLEMAVTELQMKGVRKEDILAVPLDRRSESLMLFDTVHSSDGTSMMALPMILGMIFSFFGSIFGFQLAWGPIIWAVIGAAAGFALGFGIRLLISRTRRQRFDTQNKAGVILLVRCETHKADMVKDILWSNAAMGVSKLSIYG